MILQEELGSYCPYCGESIQLLVDCSISHQEYIEDCQVCCRPIQIAVRVDESGWPSLEIKAENE